jgi:hypothetical protein
MLGKQNRRLVTSIFVWKHKGDAAVYSLQDTKDYDVQSLPVFPYVSTRAFLVNLVQHFLGFFENPLHLIQQRHLLLSSLSLMHPLGDFKVLVLEFVEFLVGHGPHCSEITLNRK